MSRCLIQDVADAVAATMLAKEEDWSYTLPRFEEPHRHRGGEPGRDLPASVRGRLAGDDGRHALAFYDREGERQHTVYLGATPEYGKAKFLGHLEAEIERAKAKCPRGPLRGDRRRAQGNWEFLQKHTGVQVTDFWHAVEYLGKAAVVLYRGQPQTRKAWLDDACHRLKHEAGRGRMGVEAVTVTGP